MACNKVFIYVFFVLGVCLAMVVTRVSWSAVSGQHFVPLALASTNASSITFTNQVRRELTGWYAFLSDCMQKPCSYSDDLLSELDALSVRIDTAHKLDKTVYGTNMEDRRTIQSDAIIDPLAPPRARAKAMYQWDALFDGPKLTLSRKFEDEMTTLLNRIDACNKGVCPNAEKYTSIIWCLASDLCAMGVSAYCRDAHTDALLVREPIASVYKRDDKMQCDQIYATHLDEAITKGLEEFWVLHPEAKERRP